MNFFKKLAQWISDNILYDFCDDVKDCKAERKAWKDVEVVPCKPVDDRPISEEELERWEKRLSRKPKTAEEKMQKTKKEIVKKKTEGKAATKAKPARDASGRFAKKSQTTTTTE